jgi:cytochrome c1
VQQSEGKPLIVSRDEVESIVPSTISIMPQGLQKTLSEQQLADLVAFLRTLKQSHIAASKDP